jgi:hypothetical protein
LQFSIPAELVEHILLGPADDRRVLQDSPLLGDVWMAYAEDPGDVQDVLVTPHRSATAAEVAHKISIAVKKDSKPQIAYLQGLVAAKLHFHDVLRVLVPMTQWWCQRHAKDRIPKVDSFHLEKLLNSLPLDSKNTARSSKPQPQPNFTSWERYMALAGLIYWIGRQQRPTDGRPKQLKTNKAFQAYRPHIKTIIKQIIELNDSLRTKALAERNRKGGRKNEGGSIFLVSLNRRASAALEQSIPAVKADAANALFKVKCKNIVWAVLDSGIDGNHPAFMLNEGTPDAVPRVQETFDFSKIREIVSRNDDDLSSKQKKELAASAGLAEADVSRYLKQMAKEAEDELPINWSVVEKLITLRNPKPPPNPHGTHVAGIIGADGKDSGYASGMCPDINFYDFRVLGKTEAETEFAVISALQYIRYVNERHNYITIHGVNLSLSIPHSVSNFACGRTPVCNECERLVESGVVVVAAAGNRGYQKFETRDGPPFESYAAFSVTDPGNADGVITVGSTHSIWPHAYGVSFFSSRGPTGDGRLKPDIVAPGERIQSTVLGHEWGPDSGTSMAAPHVSGAAAMLLARYEELIGQPRRVKRILCESATDLGRERTFQGHGMLDVLRAFQSI